MFAEPHKMGWYLRYTVPCSQEKIRLHTLTVYSLLLKWTWRTAWFSRIMWRCSVRWVLCYSSSENTSMISTIIIQHSRYNLINTVIPLSLNPFINHETAYDCTLFRVHTWMTPAISGFSSWRELLWITSCRRKCQRVFNTE